MNSYAKGAIGFLGCAALCGLVYEIGKRNGRNETLDELERQEYIPENTTRKEEPEETSGNQQEQQQTVIEGKVEKVRRMHGIKNTIFGSGSVIKDLLRNPDGKQLTVTVENGDVVARISKK